jgi:DNA-binding beta-propeller fold protein YncE
MSARDSRSRLRERAALAFVWLLGLGLIGCGTTFKLPNEVAKGREVPSDKSYQMIATWIGMSGISDILLTQGSGSQLFLLFDKTSADPALRAKVLAYPLKGRPPSPTPISGIDFAIAGHPDPDPNPVAMCAGGNQIFVLDQGDTAAARNPADGKIVDLSRYWHVARYGLLGGDTISTFTDSSLAFVRGIAADDKGNVYVSGTAIIFILDPADPRIRTRVFQYRIYKYSPGPRYPGVTPPDRNMPGANWHRDTTFVVEEGSGIGTLEDPRGIFWSKSGGDALYASDFGKNWIQSSTTTREHGLYQIDGGGRFDLTNGPVDVRSISPASSILVTPATSACCVTTRTTRTSKE